MSLTSKLQTLLNYANDKTGKNDTTLGEAVRTLADGFGSGSDVLFEFGGTNAELVASYEKTWTLDDTTFIKGSSANTTATRIYQTPSTSFSMSQINSENKDMIVIQKCIAKPTHDSSAISANLQIGYARTHVNFSSYWNENFARQSINLENYLNKYYNKSGVIKEIRDNYGFYMSPSAPSLSGGTPGTRTVINISPPALYYRVSSTIENATNIKLVTECKFDWKVEVYLVDGGSSLNGVFYNNLEKELEGE